MRRMDRYNNTSEIKEKRSIKNQELYQNIASNATYANITDVTNSNAFEINSVKQTSSYRSRESYQKMRQYQNIEPIPKVKKELDDFNYIYQKDENKVYDINSVLENARKNRQNQDALEEKRKLKNTSYNILADLNKEELEKYRDEKKKRITKPDDEEIRELIDTIASKTLAGEIDKATSINLLSDLMATNVMDKVDNPEEIDRKEQEKSIEDNDNRTIDEKLSLSKEILDQEQMKEIEQRNSSFTNSTENLKGADKEFYTRSMDLSDQDFEMSDDFKEKKLPIAIKIIIALLIITVIAIAIYFIYQRI